MSSLALQRPLLPLVWFDRINLETANQLLLQWGHKMGPLKRPMNGDSCHALVHEAEPVAVTVSSTLIREHVGGGLIHLTRENTIELSRLCAVRPHLCRLALRLWREFVFPSLGATHAISYQDAALHSGDLYRFGGWQRAAYSHSGPAGKTSSFYLRREGTEQGRPGRNKWVWVWPPESAAREVSP